MKIASLHLVPEVNKAPDDALIIASGISCRCQISHATQKAPIHLAEAIANHIKH
jgi:hypothetical protein